jgi:hypothetical protein
MNEPVFTLSRVPGAPVSDEELVADLRRVASALGTEAVSYRQYQSKGAYAATTQLARAGSWNEALRRAGLGLLQRRDVSDDELFENILVLWQHYGRQPRFRDLASSPSSISVGRYTTRFGSWMNALKAFVDYANGTGAELVEQRAEAGADLRHKTGRNPSLRLRWHVLRRDNFKCCGCGSSPAITVGVELHVDHVHPWSEGGETVITNLQTLCSKCNLGKSNLLPA